RFAHESQVAIGTDREDTAIAAKAAAEDARHLRTATETDGVGRATAGPSASRAATAWTNSASRRTTPHAESHESAGSGYRDRAGETPGTIRGRRRALSVHVEMRFPEHSIEIGVDRKGVIGAAANEQHLLEATISNKVADDDGRGERVKAD